MLGGWKAMKSKSSEGLELSSFQASQLSSHVDWTLPKKKQLTVIEHLRNQGEKIRLKTKTEMPESW